MIRYCIAMFIQNMIESIRACFIVGKYLQLLERWRGGGVEGWKGGGREGGANGILGANNCIVATHMSEV